MYLALQFGESSFDVVLDKGSLDALTGEPEEPPEAATALLSEVFFHFAHSRVIADKISKSSGF